MKMKLNKENFDKKIVYNAIKTPDGTILVSRGTHDYKTYLDKNGETYMVDGGHQYLRRNDDNTNDYEELSVVFGDGHEKIRNVFSWGSYGKDGKEDLHFIILKNITTEHIEAILRTQKKLPKYSLTIFQNELDYRNKI